MQNPKGGRQLVVYTPLTIKEQNSLVSKRITSYDMLKRFINESFECMDTISHEILTLDATEPDHFDPVAYSQFITHARQAHDSLAAMKQILDKSRVSISVFKTKKRDEEEQKQHKKQKLDDEAKEVSDFLAKMNEREEEAWFNNMKQRGDVPSP